MNNILRPKRKFILLLIFLCSCITVSDPVQSDRKPREQDIPFSGKTYRLEFVNEIRNRNVLQTEEYKIMTESIRRNLEQSVNIDRSETGKKFIRVQIFGRNDPENSSGIAATWISLFTYVMYPSVKKKVYDISFLVQGNRKSFYTYSISNTTYGSIFLIPFFWVSRFTNHLETQTDSVMRSFQEDAKDSWD